MKLFGSWIVPSNTPHGCYSEQMRTKLLLFFGCLMTISATGQSVSSEQLRNAGRDTSSWLSYGRDLLGQRYVELDQITRRTSRVCNRHGSSQPEARTAGCRRHRSYTKE